MNTNRVTPAIIEDTIRSEHYFTAAEGELGKRYCMNEDLFGIPNQLEILTICVLILKNDFTVLGVSACADPANFDPEIGKMVARADAVNKVWPLMGFALKTAMIMKEMREDSRPADVSPPGETAKGNAEMSDHG